jgi:hypothetical protein
MNERSREADMKTFITRLAIAIIALITLISISPDISKITLLYRSATPAQTQPGPEILGNSYGEMMNTLFAASGR